MNFILISDEEKTESPSVGSNSIHGKNKRMPPLKVGKMDKHIIHSDESGNDDDSCDDNHGTCEHVFSCEDDSIDKMDEGKEVENPETVKRVTENAFKTPCEKADIAMSNGQKTAQAPSKPPLQLLPRRPVTRSRKRALLTDGSTSDK